LLAKAAVEPLQSGSVIGANSTNGNHYPVREGELSSCLALVHHMHLP
jgi:hypothetical protein